MKTVRSLVATLIISAFATSTVSASSLNVNFTSICENTFFNDMTGEKFVDDLSLVCKEDWEKERVKQISLLEAEFERHQPKVEKIVTPVKNTKVKAQIKVKTKPLLLEDLVVFTPNL